MIAMEEPIIRIDGVTKRFGAQAAVDAVSLTIQRGEFFALLGPSGCGKTTLLRMLGGFAVPDSGRVILDGEDVTLLPPNRRPTNMVFQSYALFPHLNVRDNVGYGLRTSGLPEADRQQRIADALALVKLQGFELRRVTNLSGGERQRVALARAIIMRPKVLLLDEPLGALDKRLRESMQIELRAIQRELGITFVFVTHDQEEALSMADRVGVMQHGRLLQVAEPQTLYECPDSREVASFIGTMNFLPARVTEVSAQSVRVETSHGRVIQVPLRRAAARPFTAGESVTIALRPEKIEFADGNPDAPLQGRVDAISYFGDSRHIQVKVHGLSEPLIVSTETDIPAPHVGDDIRLTWRPDAPVLLAD